MKTLEKIDQFLEKLDEGKMKMGKKKVGGPTYDKFFKSMLKKWKVKSYKDLPKNKQDDFFNAVDKGWNASKETD